MNSAKQISPFPWTGERFVPGVGVNIALEHRHRYAVARELAREKDVLDIACGEGYGSDLLASVARSVRGVDISVQVIGHAAQKYFRPNLSFAVGTCAAISMPDASIDLVVSFETIEHHDQHQEMMLEIKRVLRADGVLVISSPDKRVYSDLPAYRNEFHVKELYLDEFKDLLGAAFKQVRIFGQGVYFGSLVVPLDGSAAGFASYAGKDDGNELQPGLIRPMYFIALASDAELPEIRSGLYDGTAHLPSALGGQPDVLRRYWRRLRASRLWPLTQPFRAIWRLLVRSAN